MPPRDSIEDLLRAYRNPPATSENVERLEINAPDQILKEFMRVQGAISSLTEILKEAAITSVGQYDIFETICKLLFKSQLNQEEFRRMDGYDIFLKLFDDVVFESMIREKEVVIKDCFNILFIVAVDGRCDQVDFLTSQSLFLFDAVDDWQSRRLQPSFAHRHDVIAIRNEAKCPQLYSRPRFCESRQCFGVLSHWRF